MRKYVRRRGSSATYVLHIDRPRPWFIGVTLWRKGAISFLAPLGATGVPVQVVFGDWWKAS